MSKSNIVRVGFRIPYELNTWLIEEADKFGITKNAFLIMILRDWIEAQENKKPS